jgi:hypothetical protein
MLAAAKLILIGESGVGKTGSLASLVAEGYQLRILDTDKGVKTLQSLLLDPRYPYKSVLDRRGIDIGKAVNYIPIENPMAVRTIGTDRILAPKNAKAFDRVISLVEKWKDPTCDVDYGHIATWGPECVLVLDSFSTLSKMAYYFSQSLNGRLGARDEGYDYQRDIGAAQSQLTRFLELLFDSSISCSIVIITHISPIDDSKSNKKGSDGEPMFSGGGYVPAAGGYPSAIGKALSRQMGKYFNDVYVLRQSGSGASVKRDIYTVPMDGVVAKNSVWLEQRYPVSTGLAQIFAALRNQPEPIELIEALSKAHGPGSASKPMGQPKVASFAAKPPVA